MPELSSDYLEGYTKAKEEDKQEMYKIKISLKETSQHYDMLQAQYSALVNEEKYIDLGKALATILDYIKKV